MKNNYSFFAERGDAWDAPNTVTRQKPQDVPLNIRGEAYLKRLKMERSAERAAQHKLKQANARLKAQEAQDALTVDLDHILLAGRASPLAVRLMKERNLIHPPMATAAKAKSPHPLARVAAMRRRISNPVNKVSR